MFLTLREKCYSTKWALDDVARHESVTNAEFRQSGKAVMMVPSQAQLIKRGSCYMATDISSRNAAYNAGLSYHLLLASPRPCHLNYFRFTKNEHKLFSRH